MPFNTNAVHNILNIVMALVAGFAAMDWSVIVSQGMAVKIVAALAAVKLVINALRDGLAGMMKPQPPVQS